MNREEPVTVEAVARAPQTPIPDSPFRVQGQPQGEMTSQQHEEDTPESSAEGDERESLSPETKRAAGELPSETPEPAEEKTPKEPAVNESSRDSAAEAESEEVLAIGGALVREGVRLPQLIAHWSLTDIEVLIARGYGMVVASWEGQHYRVVSRDGSLLDAEEVVVLTSKTRARLSNRGLPLNRKRRGQTWQDTASRPRFRALEERLQARFGGGRATEVPVLTFFASSEFDAYLARKQLGALAALGLNLHDLPVAAQAVTTVGTIVFAAERPVYLIHEVWVGGERQPWQDPEAHLLATAHFGKHGEGP